MKCASCDNEWLAFWQQQSRQFPMLSKLAELYACLQLFSISTCRSNVLKNAT